MNALIASVPYAIAANGAAATPRVNGPNGVTHG
jgi:hypothetical protein